MRGLTRRAAFVDRDGTLNVKPPEHEYVTRVADFVWLPGAIDGLARLARAGYALVVVSNQRGVARGLVTSEALGAIERKIQRDLATWGCAIESFRYCLHDEHDHCDCRKPRPGLITGAARALGFDLRASWMIGDSESDVEAGIAAGCRTALVTAGRVETRADVVAPSLAGVSVVTTADAAPATAYAPSAANPAVSA